MGLIGPGSDREAAKDDDHGQEKRYRHDNPFTDVE